MSPYAVCVLDYTNGFHKHGWSPGRRSGWLRTRLRMRTMSTMKTMRTMRTKNVVFVCLPDTMDWCHVDDVVVLVRCLGHDRKTYPQSQVLVPIFAP